MILFSLQPDDRRACDQDIATENVMIRRQVDESSRCLTVITLFTENEGCKKNPSLPPVSNIYMCASLDNKCA